jgi:predicted nucleic acid-binding protein
MNRQPAVLLDSVYLIATFDQLDQWSSVAEDLADEFTDRAIVTTDGVTSKFLAHCSRFNAQHRLAAVNYTQELRSRKRTEVVELSTRLVQEGIALYGGEFRYSRLRLQDCVSILVMRQRGISEALTADREFTLAGISVLMRAPKARR